MDESVATVAEQLLDRTRAFVREDACLPGAAVGGVTRVGLAWAGTAGFADLATACRSDADTPHRTASNRSKEELTFCLLRFTVRHVKHS